MNWSIFVAAALALPLATSAQAQVPSRFGRPPLPGQQCAPEYQKILKLELEAYWALQRLSRGGGEKLCASLESADELGVQKFLDPKAIEPLLTPQQRELLGAFGLDLSKVDIAKALRLLGVDLSQIDMRRLKQQCRESQGELDRFASRELSRVEGALLRCDDRV
jgi:hypothetical protein